MKKKVAILAPTGMLGSMVYNILKNRYDLILVYKDGRKMKKLYKEYGKKIYKEIEFDLMDLFKDYSKKDSKKENNINNLIKKIGKVDVVINCSGIIIPYVNKLITNTFFINSAVPHILSLAYKEKFIHITSDCVFNGAYGAPYNENSSISPNDLYGLSKSLGEPHTNSLVLRTSIIGPEIYNFNSLLEWLKKQSGKTVDGYANHLWNGVTSKQLALSLCRIIDSRSNFPKIGLFHIFSTSVSKYKLLNIIKEKYKLDVIIERRLVDKVDRRLTTVYSFCKKLNIPSIEEMISEL